MEAAQILSLFIVGIVLGIIEVNESQCDQEVANRGINSLVYDLDEHVPLSPILFKLVVGRPTDGYNDGQGSVDEQKDYPVDNELLGARQLMRS